MRQDLEHAMRISLEIARRRKGARDAMRRALESNDTEGVVRCARQLLGIEDEGHRAAARVERGASAA